MKNKNEIKMYIGLNILFMVFSLVNVLSKIASSYEFFSLKYITYLGSAVFILGIYAVAWQLILKQLPLSIAYMNRSVTVIWGLVWSYIFFGEKLTAWEIIGAIIIIVGIILVVSKDE